MIKLFGNKIAPSFTDALQIPECFRSFMWRMMEIMTGVSCTDPQTWVHFFL